MPALDDDELRELSLSITRLPRPELDELHMLILKHQPNYKARGIDLNTLTDTTLLFVQQFVRTTCVDYKGVHFLITDSPKDSNILYYLETYQKHGVTDVVRTCDADYSPEPLVIAGIQFHEMRFEDGDVAGSLLIDEWIQLVDECYFSNKGDTTRKIAVHCAAGLGRAPFLVALALIRAGMDNFEAIDEIRKQRRGAINKVQLDFILKYKLRKKSSFKRIFSMF